MTIGENFNFITVHKKPHPSYSTLKRRYVVCAFGIEMHRGHDWDGKEDLGCISLKWVRVENLRTCSLLLLSFLQLYRLYSRASINGHLFKADASLQQTQFLSRWTVHTFALTFASKMCKIRLQYIMLTILYRLIMDVEVRFVHNCEFSR